MQYEISWVNNLAEVPRDSWDAMAKRLKTLFFEWDWLRNMETSGSTIGLVGNIDRINQMEQAEIDSAKEDLPFKP